MNLSDLMPFRFLIREFQLSVVNHQAHQGPWLHKNNARD
jgi:hypothetical protein